MCALGNGSGGEGCREYEICHGEVVAKVGEKEKGWALTRRQLSAGVFLQNGVCGALGSVVQGTLAQLSLKVYCDVPLKRHRHTGPLHECNSICTRTKQNLLHALALPANS